MATGNAAGDVGNGQRNAAVYDSANEPTCESACGTADEPACESAYGTADESADESACRKRHASPWHVPFGHGVCTDAEMEPAQPVRGGISQRNHV